MVLKLGETEGIYLEQVFIVSSPMGVGYQSTRGQHVNKWIVIGSNDMTESNAKIIMKRDKQPKITKEGIVQEKIVRPIEKIPTQAREMTIPFGIIQQIEIKLDKK